MNVVFFYRNTFIYFQDLYVMLPFSLKLSRSSWSWWQTYVLLSSFSWIICFAFLWPLRLRTRRAASWQCDSLADLTMSQQRVLLIHCLMPLRGGLWPRRGLNHTGRAHLAAVTLHVEVTVQGHDANGLLLTRRRHYGLRAHTAAGGKLPARNNRKQLRHHGSLKNRHFLPEFNMFRSGVS